MNFHRYIDNLYAISPRVYDLQLNFFNGNHFAVLKRKLNKISHETIFEIGCGTAPILKTFKPKKYIGVDIDEKFILLAKKAYPQKNYFFYAGDGRNVEIKDSFDIILFSHTTHHLTDPEVKKILIKIKKYKFKHLVIYDGRPTGILAPLLTKMDYGAAKFRDVEDFMPLIGKNYKIVHKETFRANRPFYKYQLLILSKI
jgi:SAM-dependent methyltransferase